MPEGSARAPILSGKPPEPKAFPVRPGKRKCADRSNETSHSDASPYAVFRASPALDVGFRSPAT